MADKQLVDYILSQLKRGVALEKIKASCLKSGWDLEDIREAADIAIISATPTPKVNKINNDKKAHSSNFWLLVALAILVIGSGIAIAYIITTSNTASSKTNATTSPIETAENNNTISSPSPTPTVSTNSPTPTPTVEDNGPAIYENPDLGISFDCIKTWLIKKGDSFVKTYSPERTKESIGDFEIARIAYSGSKSNSIQAQDKAISISSDKMFSIVKVAGLQGYEVVQKNGATEVLVYVLTGENDMILMQFYNANDKKNLSEGQKIIFDSIKFLK